MTDTTLYVLSCIGAVIVLSVVFHVLDCLLWWIGVKRRGKGIKLWKKNDDSDNDLLGGCFCA